MTRRHLVVGNWKMELSDKGSIETTKALKKLLASSQLGVDVVICPSFTALEAISRLVGDEGTLQVGAQNVHWEEKGAWTGQVSVAQIAPHVKWCIIGHSEQRALTNETDEEVLMKAELLLKYGLTPIVCIGESLEERQADQTVQKITKQLQLLFSKLSRVALTKLVVAYEPIWAIGLGQTPDPDEAAGLMLLIRKQAAERFGVEAAERLRILYGASVKTSNVAAFVAQPGVDGVLVGGASVHPSEFVEIIKKVQTANN